MHYKVKLFEITEHYLIHYDQSGVAGFISPIISNSVYINSDIAMFYYKFSTGKVVFLTKDNNIDVDQEYSSVVSNDIIDNLTHRLPVKINSIDHDNKLVTFTCIDKDNELSPILKSKILYDDLLEKNYFIYDDRWYYLDEFINKN